MSCLKTLLEDVRSGGVGAGQVLDDLRRRPLPCRVPRERGGFHPLCRLQQHLADLFGLRVHAFRLEYPQVAPGYKNFPRVVL